MRNLLTLIVLGVLGYYGWQAWQKHPEYFTKFLPKQQEEAPAEANDSNNTATPVAANVPATPVAPAAPPAPKFNSKIVVPDAPAGERPMMPPGQFLVIVRSSVETSDGVTAIVPGDSVKLIERRGDGTLKVTNGQNDFVVKESQVTQDVLLAQEAEKREFEKHYGAVR